MDPLLAFCMAAAIACVMFGLAGLISHFFRRREHDAARVIREAALIAQARTEARNG